MGAVPKIFQTGEKVTQSQELLNQSLLLQHEDEARENQTKHEDEAREKQMLFENEQRDIQRYLIVNDTNNSLNRIEHNLRDFIHESENRSAAGATERKQILNQLLNVTKQHEIVSRDHDSISNDVKNITDNVDKNLYRYGENSIIKLDEIRKAQEKILKLLNETKK
jgi:CRISPR/Cas system CSM-associated protein Csm5 (group 7 of RAMP superfamily)